MQARCFNEVNQLHCFIQNWLKGSVEKKKDVFSLFKEALADDFQIIHPDGTIDYNDQICDNDWSVYGREKMSFSIETRNLQHRVTFGRYALVTYEEWQYGTIDTARLSTALFRESAQDGKIRWLHLHETWLPKGT